MRVGVRADASQAIGSGHVMRCLALAHQLRRRGAEVAFVCRDVTGHFGDIIKQQGFTLHLLGSESGIEHGDAKADAALTAAALSPPSPLDWMIVDHYKIDYQWHCLARQFAKHIMVIDDLADRQHDCDLILDQTEHIGAPDRYFGLVPSTARTCLGLKWIILRDEFREARRTLQRESGPVKRIVVTFGANDPVRMTERSLSILSKSKYSGIDIDLISGRANARSAAIIAQAARSPNISTREHADDVAASMVAADLALGGGGMTAWERCVLGLPSVVVGLAENQNGIGEFLGRTGLARWLGPADQLSASSLEAAIDAAIADASWRREVSSRCLEAVDGNGAIRIAAILMAT